MKTDKFQKIPKEGYTLYVNEGGPVIGAGPAMEGHILIQDGYAFKDLNRNNTLDPYEDWRLPLEERAKDLANRMDIEEIAGLMLYSAHQTITRVNPLTHYSGQDQKDTREHVWDLTEAQKKFLTQDHLRHVLVAIVDDAVSAARWNNQAQALTEGIGLGIPVNSSSDPRHTPAATAEFDMGAGGDISLWPDTLGLAAAFDPEIVKKFGEAASREYRAMGITTALSPQVDLATEPRWWRFRGTFGEGLKLATDLARAYCDAFQTSEGDRELSYLGAPGWGSDSVNAMVKHWPGGGSGEGGRDAHFGHGKYAVYPGKDKESHLKPFTEGAFKLEGKTGMASAVMPYYTISWDYDTKNLEQVGNSYNKYIITDLLRRKYGYDGVICTDWGITADPGPMDLFISGKSWGVEKLSVAERHYKVIMAGVDQFGGNNEKGPVLEAYALGVKEHGEEFMRNRFQTSARRLLRNIFRTGLFENPYLDSEESRRIAGNPAFVKAGREAQVKSIVLLKNTGKILPLANKTKVYIPRRHIKAGADFLGRPIQERNDIPVNPKLVGEYFELVEKPEQADCALCFIEAPQPGFGYSREEGYLPISLQYRPYTAKNAREKNLAGEDNRSYRGKTGTVKNEEDLDLVQNTRKQMGTKPMVVIVKTGNPFVAAEFEGIADAVILHFAIERRPLLDILSGKAEPSGLLPFQMPKDMETVEAQAEDLARDMVPYTDSNGKVWDFAYGLNWQGQIKDGRTARYS